jgi:hypothetical protein
MRACFPRTDRRAVAALSGSVGSGDLLARGAGRSAQYDSRSPIPAGGAFTDDLHLVRFFNASGDPSTLPLNSLAAAPTPIFLRERELSGGRCWRWPFLAV